MPILDGRKVDADQIDPAKHRYVGPWRHPLPPTLAEFERYPATTGRFCLCGSIIYTSDREVLLRKHWQKGCFDEPQYVTMTRTQWDHWSYEGQLEKYHATT